MFGRIQDGAKVKKREKTLGENNPVCSKPLTQSILVVPHLECTTSAWEQGSLSDRGEVCLLYVTGSGLLSSMTAHLYEEYLPECQTADNTVRNGV